MVTITLKGIPPSKKNSRQIFCRGGRPVNIPSKDYLAWHEEQMWLIKKVKPVKGEVAIDMQLYAPNLRTGDLENKFSSVQDLLVDAGIIDDDNWDVVKQVMLNYAGVDKQSPRVEITIYPLQ